MLRDSLPHRLGLCIFRRRPLSSDAMCYNIYYYVDILTLRTERATPPNIHNPVGGAESHAAWIQVSHSDSASSDLLRVGSGLDLPYAERKRAKAWMREMAGGDKHRRSDW